MRKSLFEGQRYFRAPTAIKAVDSVTQLSVTSGQDGRLAWVSDSARSAWRLCCYYESDSFARRNNCELNKILKLRLNMLDVLIYLLCCILFTGFISWLQNRPTRKKAIFKAPRTFRSFFTPGSIYRKRFEYWRSRSMTNSITHGGNVFHVDKTFKIYLTWMIQDKIVL